MSHVWLIDPRERRAWSYTRDGRREAVQVLRTANPEISLSIAGIFAELDEMGDFSDE